MKRNLEKSGGAVFSEKVLLALVEKGVVRDTAYRMVQRHALKVGKEGGDLKREILQDAEIRRHLTAQEIEAIWGVKHHLANVDFIFRRAFG
jgi:adenylosuccinate lyase